MSAAVRFSLRLSLSICVTALALSLLSSNAFAGSSLQVLPSPLPGSTAPVVLEPGDQALVIDHRLDPPIFPSDLGVLAKYDPSWDLLDRMDRPYTLDRTPFPTPFTGTFTSAVFRDPATKQLIFGYFADAGPQDGGSLTLSGFAGFHTETTADFDEEGATATRSADGATIQYVPPDFMRRYDVFIATDAKFFNTLGSAHVHTMEQFPEMPDAINDVDFTTFAPSATQAVPLPPALWAAGAMLLGLATIRAGKLGHHSLIPGAA
jgi:hypothetical protein